MTIYARQLDLFDDDAEYKAFTEKFKPKKTTDDCYTPDNVFEAVRDWACREYGIDPASIVRPFWPGGDYERFDYPDGCFVLDNPPFSILSKIVRFYMRNKVRFFLFAPALSTFTASDSGCNYVCAGIDITYANGANVNTSFITSEGGDVVVRTAPDLYRTLKAIDKANKKEKTKTLRKYVMPDAVATAARMNWLSANGTEFRVRRKDAAYIHDLDCGANLFGGAFLLSESAAAERAAAERVAAERVAAERVALSERELEIQRRLGREEQ